MNTLNGVSQQDFDSAIKMAKTNDNEKLIATLYTARGIVELFDFEHIRGIGSLKLAILRAQQKINLLEKCLEPIILP